MGYFVNLVGCDERIASVHTVDDISQTTVACLPSIDYLTLSSLRTTLAHFQHKFFNRALHEAEYFLYSGSVSSRAVSRQDHPTEPRLLSN
jgi:hypothetical protein